MSLNHLKEFTDYYSLPTLRRVTKNVFEIYYGGVKMCRDEVKGKVFGCDDNETFTKWEITEIFGNIITSFRDDTLLYNIIHDNQCLTVKEGGLIQMEECKKGENQIFSIKMVPIMPDFLFEGGPMEKYKEMKKSQKALLRKYKLESMFN
ncbi:hypothetical protein TCON_0301 [Astathelohania contejeani]|uniref:Uncharacterized protein n=1 Tax=Astathelohania contejeani TaxID=164912 RepID=A0ABQ7I265_9MICR|nr:hypothetical protein TCON_0301 [Thelohania contejeani]